ncbi:hypothetical protein ETD86_13795 [Nonomuraea turkmeniaca]|uniref:Secreted protein n=1 Tax=Nonomuraea turkmeniaca TaxID=103838 RepID=A0A5S4FNS3_9ACTN|nr:hypothetical protein [Nonomuraea turkmeniaca]TMR21861.1 hypothetical protein ETD86_13795 [Nonomuraea turkmeniaca]
MSNGSRALIGITAAVVLTMAAMPAASAAAASDAGSPQARPGTAGPAWGPYYSPGAKRAKALGRITATGEDHEVIPSAATLTVSGKVTDLTRASTCGWAVFGIATVNSAGNKVTWKQRHVRTCAYRTPKTFSFTYHRVYQVDLKVCAEGRAAGPSIQCTAGNPAWKTLYISPH